MRSAMKAFFIGLFLLMGSGMAFADVPRDAVDPNTAPVQVYVQPAAPAAVPAQPVYAQPVYGQPVYGQPVYAQPVYAQPVPAQQSGISSTGYNWGRDSRIYKGVGWGFFGGGLLLSLVIAPAVYFGGGVGSAIEGDEGGAIGSVIASLSLWALGGAMTITGIGVLIAEAVKFNPYRRGEIAGLEFEWSPQLYVSPEFNGLGLHAKF